jgi:hypothetical protein
VLPSKSWETPLGPFQKSSREYPNVTVGMMNGMSASVSIMLSQRDLPLAINHAKGKPAINPRKATRKAIPNEA